MKVILCILILLLAIPLFAQPVGEECWLRVVLTSPDKVPITIETGMVPELYLITGETKRRDGVAQIIVKNGEINLIGLTVGKHEFFVTLGSYGFRFGPIEINITEGSNIYEWELPRLTPVEMQVMDGTEKVKVNNPLCYIIPKSRGTTVMTAVTGGTGVAAIKGLLPDTYRILVISRDPDYYITADLTITEGQAEAIKVKDCKVVKINSALVFTIVPPPAITVAYQLRINLSGKFDELNFTPYVLTIRDKVERFPLPAGNYTYMVYVPTCKPIVTKITVVDGKTENIDLKPTP
ncbi:MAG: hypothetical protein WCO98_03660 [bacterium]